MSWAFVFAALYLWGIVPAVLLQVLAVVLGQLLLRRSPWRIFFNIGQYTLSLLAAWGVLVVAGVSTDMSTGRTSFSTQDLSWIVLSWVAFHLVNLALVAGTAATEGQSWWEAFTEDFWYYTFSMFAVLAMAPFVVVMAAVSWQFVPLLLLPLFGVYKTASLARQQERQAMHDALTDCPTGRCSRSGSRTPSPSPCATEPGWPCSCSTSIASRRSTTPWATPRVTSSSRSSPAGC